MLDETRPNPGCIKPILTIVAILLVLAWGTVAIANADALWFMPGVSGEAQEVVIYREGQVITLKPGDASFNQVVSAVHDNVSKITSNPPGGLSEDSLKLIRTRQSAVEVRYKGTAMIHSTYGVGKFDTLLIPLSGWQGGEAIFYTAQAGYWIAKTPSIGTENLERIRAGIAAAGY